MMQTLLDGPIAMEYGVLAATKKKKVTTPTCGDNCTDPKRGPIGNDSCPLIPSKPPKKNYKAFAPVVAGWSEPPAGLN
jgi:hypothetical protein